MKTIRNFWVKAAGATALTGLALFPLYEGVTVWAQSAPVLSIALSTNNQVSITITNGSSTGQYQLYWADSMSESPDWLLLTNGLTGQTNFQVDMSDTEEGYFQAAYNPAFTPPVINIIIQSPLNGSVLN